MSLISEIPKEFPTLSCVLDEKGDAAIEFEKLRKAAQLALDSNSIQGEVIQMLYDFGDRTLIFKISKR